MPIATFSQSTSAINTPVYILVGSEDLIVAQNVVLSTTGSGSEVVQGNGSNYVTVHGQLLSLLAEGIAFGSFGARLLVGRAGSISSALTNGVAFADGGTVLNDGTISGGTALRSAFGSLSVQNSGAMIGLFDGVSASSTVFGSSAVGTLNLFNSGLISAGNTAVININLASSVSNTGTITATTAILLNNSSALASASVTNSGEIRGNVILSGGADIFDGALGRTFGTINAGGGDDLLLTGANADNILAGAGSDEVVSGGGRDTVAGGTGNDLLDGGDGDDILDGGDGADMLIGGAGLDRARFSDLFVGVAASLADSSQNAGEATGDSYGGIEGLIGGGGNDTLTGDGQANWLDGGGGVDSLVGGAGDDRFEVDDLSDVVIELAGGGNDTVVASTSYALGAGQAIEYLRGRGATGLLLVGNELNNRLFGTEGADALIGGGGVDILTGDAGNDRLDGGLGNDRLNGGEGNDVFVFATALSSANNDRLLDFVGGPDRIEIDNAVFTGLAAGALPAAAFQLLGVDAKTAATRIIYNEVDGALYFDPDGTGAGAVVRFATLSPGDFLVAGYITVI